MPKRPKLSEEQWQNTLRDLDRKVRAIGYTTSSSPKKTLKGSTDEELLLWAKAHPQYFSQTKG